MPHRPRVSVEEAIYHVYKKLAQGGTLLGERAETERFVALLREARDRDGLTILASPGHVVFSRWVRPPHGYWKGQDE